MDGWCGLWLGKLYILHGSSWNWGFVGNSPSAWNVVSQIFRFRFFPVRDDGEFEGEKEGRWSVWMRSVERKGWRGEI